MRGELVAAGMLDGVEVIDADTIGTDLRRDDVFDLIEAGIVDCGAPWSSAAAAAASAGRIAACNPSRRPLLTLGGGFTECADLLISVPNHACAQSSVTQWPCYVRST